MPTTGETVTLNTSLTLTQVCALLEKRRGESVPRSTVSNYSVRVGEFEALVPPSKRSGHGRGRWDKSRLYSVSDVVLLWWVFTLKEQGLEVRKFFRAVAWVREHMHEGLDDPRAHYILTDNRELGLRCREGNAVQLTGVPGQILLSLHGSMVERVLKETPAVLVEAA